MEIGLEHFESCAIRKVPKGTRKGRALMSALPTESSEIFRSTTRWGSYTRHAIFHPRGELLLVPDDRAREKDGEDATKREGQKRCTLSQVEAGRSRSGFGR